VFLLWIRNTNETSNQRINVTAIHLRTGTGIRRCTSATKTHTAGYFILYGQNIYGYILLGNVNQVVGARLQSVLHQRVVLARFRDCHGKSTGYPSRSLPILLSDLSILFAELIWTWKTQPKPQAYLKTDPGQKWIELKLLEDDLRLFSYALSQPTPFTVCCLGQYDSLLMKNQLSPSLYLKCILRTIVW